MTRLNKQIKAKILENALTKAGVFSKDKDLAARRAKLAENVRLFAIGGKEVEDAAIKAMEKINQFLSENGHDSIIVFKAQLRGINDEIHVNFAGRSVNLSFNGNWGEPVTKPLVMSSYRNRVAITADNPLSQEFDFISQEHRSCLELKQSITLEVEAMLSSVTTIAKLLKEWPESEDLIPDDISLPQSTSLAVNVSNLNRMIGLPEDKKE